MRDMPSWRVTRTGDWQSSIALSAADTAGSLPLRSEGGAVIVAVVAEGIVGRTDELVALHEFLDHPPQGPGALVLEGIAGIGKSTLWSAALGEAHLAGHSV